MVSDIYVTLALLFV